MLLFLSKTLHLDGDSMAAVYLFTIPPLYMYNSLSTTRQQITLDNFPNSTHQNTSPNPEISNIRPSIDHDLLCNTETEEQKADNKMRGGKIP